MKILENEIVQLTPTAKQKVQEILLKEVDGTLRDKKGLRLSVVGGGCSGLTYKMDIGELKDNDNVFSYDGHHLMIDPKSSVYLKGVILDYKDGLNGKGFVFENPYAKNKCGCGESFSLV